MNFLLDCSVEDENDEICMFDFTNNHLQDKFSSDIHWVTFKQTRVNAELVSLAIALNVEKQIVFIRTENSKKIKVTHTTIEDTLTMHYPIEERNLKQPGNDDTSRRSRRMYKDAIKICKDVFLNENIITVKRDNASFLDDEDYHEVIAETGKNVSLNVSAILELVHTKIGDVPYSLEAALLSSAHIRFHTGIDGYACDYQIFCECCKQNIYNNETAPFPMDKAMMVLPDAIFCHKFMAILGKEKIGQYLFDKDFEVTGKNMCTNCIPCRDTCIDCCIGNDQQILNSLSSNKSFKVRIQEMLDIVDAFFRVIPMPKKTPILERYISAPRKNDEIQVVQFIERTLSKTLIGKLGNFFTNTISKLLSNYY
jgi:hypothetical protein